MQSVGVGAAQLPERQEGRYGAGGWTSVLRVELHRHPPRHSPAQPHRNTHLDEGLGTVPQNFPKSFPKFLPKLTSKNLK